MDLFESLAPSMSGDWIKVQGDTAHKPEVLKIARMLDIPKAHAFGLVVTFWAWCDRHTVDGLICDMTEEDFDIEVSHKGFSAAMKEVKWLLKNDDGSFLVPKFERHNSASAKKRAQASQRQQTWRESVREAAGAKPEAKNGNHVEIPTWLEAEQFKAWIKVRPSRARTADAQVAAIRKLDKFRSDGLDPNAIVRESLSNGWQGLFRPDGSNPERDLTGIK